MYLGSPRMAEEVIGEKVTLEEMGGARMHATVSGCGDNLATDDADAIEHAGVGAAGPDRLKVLLQRVDDVGIVLRVDARQLDFDPVGAHRPDHGLGDAKGVDAAAENLDGFLDLLLAHRIVELGIAHVPEHRRLFPRMTVEDNLRIVEGWTPPIDFATMPRLTFEVYKAENAA